MQERRNPIANPTYSSINGYRPVAIYVTEYENNRPNAMLNENMPKGYINTDGLVQEGDSHSTHERIIPYPNRLDPVPPPATTRRRIASKGEKNVFEYFIACIDHIANIVKMGFCFSLART